MEKILGITRSEKCNKIGTRQGRTRFKSGENPKKKRYRAETAKPWHITKGMGLKSVAKEESEKESKVHIAFNSCLQFHFSGSLYTD